MAILALFVFLCANTAVGQLLRVHTLIHHYFEHVEWDDNPSFIDFLEAHYACTIDHPDDKHGDHQKLPLRAAAHQAGDSLKEIAQPPHADLSIIPFFVERMRVHYQQPFFYNNYQDLIWQPPRFS